MAAQDIRRQSQDAEATAAERFVRPGVTNTAIADAITGVGGSLIELDVALAKERLGKDLDASRSEFLTGELTDASQGNDPELQAQLDKELSPFRQQLSKMSNAQQQGLLRGDRFKMQADAILQAHIARRPGLAPEFREIHAQYTGGAIIETIMRHEQEQFDAAMRAAAGGEKDKQERAEKNRTFQLNAMKDAGFVAEAGALAHSSPEEVNAKFMEFYPQIARQAHTQERAATLKAAAEGMEAGYALDRPASLQTWQAGYDLALEGVLKTIRESSPQLAAADETNFAAMMGEWQGALAKVKSNLESERTRLGLKPDDVAAQMKIIADMEESGAKLLDGTIEMGERKRRIEAFKLRLEATLQNDQPLLASITTLEEKGAHEVVKWMYEQNHQLSRQTAQEMMDFVVNGAGNPAVVSPLAGGFTQSLLKSMFPEGSQTKNKYVDSAAAEKLLSDFGKAFVVTPTDQVKVKPYTEWIEELTAYQASLTKLLSPEGKKELAETVRLSARKMLRAAVRSLIAEHPQLRTNITYDPYDFNSILKLKQDDPTMEKVLDQANQQLAYGRTVKLLAALGGYPDEQAAHVHVMQSEEELRGAENLGQMALQERRKAAQGQAGTGVQGQGGCPPVGHVEDGWRYVGGDCSTAAGWEKVGG